MISVNYENSSKLKLLDIKKTLRTFGRCFLAFLFLNEIFNYKVSIAFWILEIVSSFPMISTMSNR